MQLSELMRLRRIDVINKGYTLNKWRVSWGAYAEKGKSFMLTANVGDDVLAIVRGEGDEATEEVVRSTSVMYMSAATGEEVK